MTSARDNTWLHRYAVFTACATFCLIIAGALVTSNDAGLAVPDWPLSYGSLMPPMVGNIRFEHGHRMVAAFVGMLTIGLAVWLARCEERRWVRRLGWGALAAVMAQGLLGGITVLFFLPAVISVSHACLAQIFFCLTVTLAIVTGRGWREPAGAADRAADRDAPALAQLAALTVAAIFLQLILGAAFRHKGFGIIPHLAGAAVVAAMVMWTFYRVMSRHSTEPGLTRPAALLGLLLLAQLLLGASSYIVREITRDAPQPMPVMVWVTTAHVATGALTLASGVWLLLSAHRFLGPARQAAFSLPGGNRQGAVSTT
jgi:cytochrome c oxidase assembly protein subunit 15